MPTDSSVLGFSNRWYEEGIETALPYGSGEEGTDIILELIQRIAEIE